MASTFNDTLEQIRVVRLELHEELMKNPQYRALTALDDLLKIIEKSTEQPKKIIENPEVPTPSVAVKIEELPKPTVVPVNAPQPVVEVKKKHKPLTQVQALVHVLTKKDSPASIGWLLAELELLNVTVGGLQPRKSLGVVLSSNKDLFRRVEYDGGRWMWGMVGRKYAGETTFDHLRPTEFKSMRVRT